MDEANYQFFKTILQNLKKLSVKNKLILKINGRNEIQFFF